MAEFFSPGPGERLRAARLSMGFDLAKIASELHLTSLVVEALEADDFRDIGARVFVRGYLRNYARIVGMPVESILRQFDEKWPDDGALHSMVRESPTLPADGGPSRGLAGAMTWLLIIGLIVLFLMWWRGYLDEIVPEQIRSSTLVEGLAPATMTPPASELLPAPPMLDSEPSRADGSLRLPAPPPDGEPVRLEEPGADEPPAAAPVGDASSLPLPAAVTGAEPASGQPIAAAVEPDPADVAAVAPVVAGSDAAEGAPVVEGRKQIVMTFNAACWVDVRDSERKFKLFGEMPKGTRKVLGGEPPYKLVIGNAQAVSITVNGEPYDLGAYAKGNVARFTLDP